MTCQDCSEPAIYACTDCAAPICAAHAWEFDEAEGKFCEECMDAITCEAVFEPTLRP